jgi:hypothetical protein
MKRSTILLIIIFVSSLALVTLYTFKDMRKTQTPVNQKVQQLEVLEAQDFNQNPTKLQLHVQSHGDFQYTPKSLVLKDKTTNKVRLELPLTASTDPHECSSHEQMMEDMKKWETDWFTIEELGTFDASYNSKLGDKYNVEIKYEEGQVSETLTMKDITGVCYQVSKTAPLTPNPKEEAQEGKE